MPSIRPNLTAQGLAAVVVQRQLAIPPFHARTGTHEPAHPLRTHALDYLLEFFPQAAPHAPR